MKRASIILSLLLVFAVVPANGVLAQMQPGGAQARQDNLRYVAASGVPGADGQLLSLCAVEKDSSLMSLPIWRSAAGYALATNRCEIDSHLALAPEEFTTLQNMGLVSRDLPPAPGLTFSRWAAGCWGLPLLALALALAVSTLIFRGRAQRPLATQAQAPGLASQSEG